MQSVSSNAVAQTLQQSYLTRDFCLQRMNWSLSDNGTGYYTIPNYECYLFINIHTLNNPAQITLVRCYQNVIKVNNILAGQYPVNITATGSNNQVKFQASGVCRGSLWRLNGASPV
jgi:hypothetical protein